MDAGPLPHDQSRARRIGKHVGWALGTVCLIAGLVLLAINPYGRHAAPTPDKVPTSRLAVVLPVVVENAPEYEWARLGLMDLVAQRVRLAGQATVPSDSVVALLDATSAESPADRLAHLKEATRAETHIEGYARRNGERWHVELELTNQNGKAIRKFGESDSITHAADAAVGQLVEAMGLVGPPAVTKDGTEGLVQQIRSLMLQDQLDSAVALIDAAPAPVREEARIRYQSARIRMAKGDLDAASTLLAELDREPSTQEDREFRARIRLTQAALALREHRFGEAEQRADEAVRLSESMPARADSPMGGAFLGRASARAAQGKFDAALDDFAAARLALATTGDVRLLTMADLNFGAMQMQRDHFQEAIEPLQRAADLSQRLRAPTDELMARINLGSTYLALMRPESARKEAEAIADLQSRAADPAALASASLMRAEIDLGEGDLRAATRELESLALRIDTVPAIAGPALSVEANIAVARGDDSHAIRRADESLAKPWDGDELRSYARTWLLRVRVGLAQSPPQLGNAEKSVAWATANGSSTAQLYASLAMAEEHAAMGDAGAAEDRFQTAFAQAEATNVPIDIAETSTSYANWLVKRGDLARATAVLGPQSGLVRRDVRPCGRGESTLQGGRQRGTVEALARAYTRDCGRARSASRYRRVLARSEAVGGSKSIIFHE